MKTLNDKSHLGVEGHVVIRDADSQEVLLNKYNAINFENFALAVANSMANQTTNSNNHFIAKLAFGYGGTTIDANGNVTYKDPKVSGSTGGLYSPSPATIGANATIVCGITLGRYCFIGAGAVVTKDIPDYGLVLGNPGKLSGYMSRHGHKLAFNESDKATCPESKFIYEKKDDQVHCLDLSEEEALPPELSVGFQDYDSFKS